MGALAYVDFQSRSLVRAKTDSLYKSDGKRKATKADSFDNKEQAIRFQNALLERRHGIRDYLLFVLQLTSGRRISDIVKLNFGDVYDFRAGEVLKSFEVFEKKTKKYKKIPLQPIAIEAIELYVEYLCEQGVDVNMRTPLIYSQVQKKEDAKNVDDIGRISTRSAWRIYVEAAEACGIRRDEVHVSTHTPRKTIGTFYYEQFGDLEGISKMYNHDNERVTRAYCGITDKEVNNKVEILFSDW